MGDSLRQRDHSALPVRAEKCATASLRKPERRLVERSEAGLLATGAAVERARLLRGWTLDELSGFAERNDRQIARWIKGQERAQFDVLFAIKDAHWRNALVIALAELGTGVEIDTVIRLRIKESA